MGLTRKRRPPPTAAYMHFWRPSRFPKIHDDHGDGSRELAKDSVEEAHTGHGPSVGAGNIRKDGQKK
jgi:DUF1365 family protein